MIYNYYSNLFAQPSLKFVKGLLFTAIFLFGLAFLVYVLRDLFAILFAIFFSAAAFGCIGTAVKIYMVVRKFNKQTPDPTQGFRKNVIIHDEDISDL